MNEQQLESWSQAPSPTEQERSKNAVTEAIAAVVAQFGSRVSSIRQGSYHNRTNVRLDSDVDVAVIYDDSYFADTTRMSAQALAGYDAAWTPSSISFAQFKQAVEFALRTEFGNRVERRNKCIVVNGTDSRNSCDVVPAFNHRRYNQNGQITDYGIEFITDQNQQHVVSFPRQHYNNGVWKHEDTNKGFKRIVRIIKRARNVLVDRGHLADGIISSFFIECLVYNIAKDAFARPTWKERVNEVLNRVYYDMGYPSRSNAYIEVSALDPLFRGNRTPQQARAFAELVWDQIQNG
ncbi:MAG TPA: nucleotidyltransferase [Rhizomicrobium sp.]|jgi:hypothetical protein|nr:nucleotidyltransferase [Rhizomicrobium sp.]